MATSKFSKNVTLRDMHSLITCRICGGYFVDATTITECLHTFCRSCIVKHFKKSLFCPECDVQVERGCPLNKLRPDPRKQLLAYKMVPHLHENEVARQWNFLKKHKPLSSSDQPVIGQRPLLPGDLPEETIRDRIVDKIHLYSPEDKISLSVEYDSGVDSGGCPSDKQLNSHKRYLQCPAALTVYHLKKFIRLKYDIGTRFKVTIFYEGEPLPDSSSLMDVAYQFFYEAKCPMRFTYRVSLCDILKAMENVSSRSSAVPAKSPPTVSVKPSTPSNQTTTTLTARPTVRHQGSMSSAASSSDESTASNRRQQRQRSAKTAAYTAIEAMESDHDEAKNPPKRRRLAAKSPRWESDRDSPEPFPARVYITRRTPKTSLEDFEARYNTRPAVKRVYATNSDDDMSDPETKRNTLANKGVSKYGNFLNSLKAESEGIGRPKSVSNGRKPRSKRADEDVYEFNVNEDNEDSNTTQEYDFVYDNSDHETSELEKRREMNGSDRADRMERANVHENGSAAIDDDLNDVDADEHELEQQIEMEVITDTDDIERHIEDSIEEVEVDADDDNQDNEESQSALDDQLEAETTSSTCLVIAEDDEDDGVVEEVIAAEENGHELVVVEDPEENEISYPTESEKLSEDASRSPVTSTCSKSPTVEEDEPEIVHEKVFRKKSKKSKHHHHHHHHHHHKRKRHHSPLC